MLTRNRTLVLISAFIAVSDTAASQSPFQLRDGVVVDPSRNVLYAMSNDGGIRALDIRGGQEVWASNVAAKPLAVVNNFLVAQVEPTTATNVLQLRTVNADAPTQIVSTRTATLPADVVVGVDQTAHKAFLTSARVRGAEAEVSWQYISRVPQGIAPPRPASSTPAAAGRAGGVAVREPAQERSVQTVARAGGVILDVRSGAITTTAPRAGQVDTLRRVANPSDAAAASVQRTTSFLSADGLHVLESVRIADDRVWEQYRWRVYDSRTRALVGQIGSHMAVSPFFVRDSLLVFATDPYVRREEGSQPLKLRAYDLATGRERWSTEIRDTKVRVAFPP